MLQKRTKGEYEAEGVDWVLIAPLSVWWGHGRAGSAWTAMGPSQAFVLHTLTDQLLYSWLLPASDFIIVVDFT